MTPTARTLAYYRKLGYTAGVVEKWNPHVGGINKLGKPHFGIRQDLWGVFDIIAFNDWVVFGVQAKGQSGHPEAVEKLKSSVEARRWALNEARACEVVSWAKRKRKLKGGEWSKGFFYTPFRERVVYDFTNIEREIARAEEEITVEVKKGKCPFCSKSLEEEEGEAEVPDAERFNRTALVHYPQSAIVQGTEVDIGDKPGIEYPGGWDVKGGDDEEQESHP